MSRERRQSGIASLVLALLAAGALAALLYRAPGGGAGAPAGASGPSATTSAAVKPSWDVAALRGRLPGLLVVRHRADLPSELRVVSLSLPDTETVLWTAPRGAKPRLLAMDRAGSRIALYLPGPPQQIVMLSGDGTGQTIAVGSNRQIGSGAFDGADLLMSTYSFVEPTVRAGTPLRLATDGTVAEASVTKTPRKMPLARVVQLRDGRVAGVFSPEDFGNPALLLLKRDASGWQGTGRAYVGQADAEPWDALVSAATGPGVDDVAFLQRHVASDRVWFDVARLRPGGDEVPTTFARSISAEQTTGPQAITRTLETPVLGAGPRGYVLAALEESRGPVPGDPLSAIGGGPGGITYRLERIAASGQGEPLAVRLYATGPHTGPGRVPYFISESWLWLDDFGGR